MLGFRKPYPAWRTNSRTARCTGRRVLEFFTYSLAKCRDHLLRGEWSSALQ